MDNGYISDYLTHWTGRSVDEETGFNNLSSILKHNRLKLSYNPLVIMDIYNEIHEKMVCFTDVPLSLSAKHCNKYGKFGIVFDKRKLANKGAHPVFYFTHTMAKDIKRIFNFIVRENHNESFPVDLFEAFKRFFYFTQEYSKGRIDSTDAFYYEREWRIGEQTLVSQEMINTPNFKYERSKEGKPLYFGILEKDEKDESYFKFEDEGVYFIIVPKIYQNSSEPLVKGRPFQLEFYEDLIKRRNYMK